MSRPILRMLSAGLCVASAMAAIGSGHRPQGVTASAFPDLRAVEVNWTMNSDRPLRHTAGSMP